MKESLVRQKGIIPIVVGVTAIVAYMVTSPGFAQASIWAVPMGTATDPFSNNVGCSYGATCVAQGGYGGAAGSGGSASAYSVGGSGGDANGGGAGNGVNQFSQNQVHIPIYGNIIP